MAKKILVNGIETVSFTNFGAAEKVKKQNESISVEQAPAENAGACFVV